MGGIPNLSLGELILMRGNLESLLVPFNWFRTRPGGPKPNFKDFEIIDHGQTVRLGKYEVSVDSILYDFDPKYRAKTKENALNLDDSFGGAVRRLRLFRGLNRDDFKPLTANTIACIERNEIENFSVRTLTVLAKKLKVKPEEISTY